MIVRSQVRVRIVLLVAALTFAMTGIASAQTALCDPADPECGAATVTTTATTSGRMLSLHDMTGADLASVPLRSGQARPFEVRVNDEAMSLDRSDFRVQSYLTDLHPVVDGTLTSGGPIPSANVEAQFALNPAAMGAAADLSPRYLLSMTGLACEATGTLLEILETDAVCKMLYDLHDLNLVNGLDALLGLNGVEQVTASFTDIPIALGEPLDVSLAGLPLPSLPIALNNGAGGSYAEPDCGAQILGQTAPSCETTGPTAVELMLGSSGGIDALLDGVLDDARPTVGAIVSETGAGALWSLVDLAGAIGGASGTLDEVAEPVSSIASALGSMDAVDLDALLSVSPVPADLGDILNLTGAWRGFPALVVDTAGYPTGDYVGTLTVQLIEDFN